MNLGLPILCLFTLFWVSAVRGSEDGSVRVLYLKNNGQFPACVFVDGSYQGIVPVATAKYLAFESQDNGPVVLTIQSMKTPRSMVSNNAIVFGDANGVACVWFGERSAGPTPHPAEWKNASRLLDETRAYFNLARPGDVDQNIQGVTKTTGTRTEGVAPR